MPRFSANLSYLFTEHPFLERFAAAASAGFRAVEFTFAYEHAADDIRRAADRHHLEVVLLNAPAGDYASGERGLASLPGREDEYVASIMTAIEYAQALRCPRIHVMAGIVPSQADAATLAQRHALHRQTLLVNLHFACATAAEHGIDIMLEALNPFDVPGYFYSTQGEVHAVREAVGAANLKAQLDFYHAQRSEGSLTQNLERWWPHVGHMQIASVPGRHEPDAGEINYAHLFARIDALGCDAWVGCEYRPRTTTAAGLAWRERLGVR